MSAHHKALAKRSNPDSLPLFLVDGAIVLPACDLPLNVFEPRYLNMIDDVLRTDRLIGIVQPVHDDDDDTSLASTDKNPLIGHTGTLGRIIQFSEAEDGRYSIFVRGLKRFGIRDIIEDDLPYDRAHIDFENFTNDIEAHTSTISTNSQTFQADKLHQDRSERSALTMAMKSYARTLNVELDWDHMKSVPLNRLVDQACMISPFRPEDKQSLLEAPTHHDRRRLLIGLMHLHSDTSLYQSSPGSDGDRSGQTLQ